MSKDPILARCICCGQPVEFMTFDRSDWSSKAYLNPKAPGTEPSYEQEIERSVKERGFWFGRTDIALLNVGEYGTKFRRQYCIEPYYDGRPRGEGIEFLTTEGLKRVTELNRKLLDVCKDHPWMYWKVHGCPDEVRPSKGK